MTTKELPAPRYEYGGDEFVFVNIDEEMSIEANFKVMAVTQELEKEHLPGIVDICPANSSYMIRLDPDTIDPRDLVHELQEIDKRVGNATSFEIRTRIVDVPVMYRDPWTHETLMRFRDRHQAPDLTDLEYAAKINGYATVEDFIAASSGAPYLATMVGFVPGLPWCYQMVPRERQIEVPKYLRPRTDTPERTFGHGGCFAVVYPVRGAGGYQLFGIAPAPIFDPAQRLPDFKDSIVFPRQGDIFKFRRIDRDEYDRVRGEVDAGTFRYRYKEIRFHPDEFLANPDKYNEEILGVLYGD